MRYLSNDYVFPFLQIVLLGIVLWAIYRDYIVRGPVNATVTRAQESMSVLQKATGLVIAGLVTITNKSVFDTETYWKDYSAFFNVFDLLAIAYLCYFSSWGRNKIIGIYISSKTEKR